MPLDTNLNVAPYFDDFDETKNFHRILFKPSNAVQTRELNQIQSILQNQIERFGSAIFKDGAVISGCKVSTYDTLPYIRLSDHDSNGNLIVVGEWIGKTVESVATGLKGNILTVKTGTEQQYPWLNRLYVNYLNSGYDAANNQVSTFQANEVLRVYDNPRAANVVLATVNSYANSTTSYPAAGTGYGVTVGEGIVYQKGFFIRSEEQTAIVSDSINAGNAVVGFITNEQIISAEQDDTLYDNALGYANPTAPGADRLKLVANLHVLTADDVSTTDSFTSIVQYISGYPVIENPDQRYAALGDEMARARFETNGSFIIKPFKISTDTGNSTFFTAQVAPGSGYAQGFRVELLKAAPVAVRRGTDQVSVESQLITANYGNYILVNEFSGVFNFSSLQTIDLYDAPQQAVSKKTFSSTTMGGNKIGTATIRCIKYDSGVVGSPTAAYQVYLFNINMNAGKNFATQVKSIGYTSAANGIADIILAGGQATLYNSERRSLVYQFGQRAIKNLKDAANNINTQYIVRARSTSTLGVDGQVALTLTTSHAGGTNEFPYGIGVLGNLESEFTVVTHAATQTNNLGNVSVSGVTATGPNFAATFSPSEYIRVGSDIRRIVSVVGNTITVDAAFSAANTAIPYSKYFPAGYSFPLVDTMVGVRTINIQSPTSLVINTGASVAGALTGTVDVSIYHNILRYNAVPAKKTINKQVYVKIDTATHPAGNKGPWSLGFVDVHQLNSVQVDSTFNNTSNDVKSVFFFDTGMRDTHYDIATLSLRPGETIPANSKILACVDVFSLNTTSGVGFLSVDSYPVDDNNTANTSAITTANIPVYITDKGTQMSLRDCIDFRPHMKNMATLTANVASATINPPLVANGYNIDTVGTYVPSVDTNFETDLTFYLGRKDIIYFSNKGFLKSKSGAPSASPVTPAQPTDGMGIAVINIPPFPSLSATEQSALSAQNRLVTTNIRDANFVVGTQIVTNKRYRMQDIGTLDQRISRLEYYMTLNMLEQATTALQVPDANGLDRFKNGIFVDPFTNFTLSDVSNPEFRIAIDTDNGILRPYFTETRPELEFSLPSSSSVQRTGRLLTLPYTNVLYSGQPYATNFRSCSSVQFKWTGQMVLYPNYGHNVDKQQDVAINNTLDLTTPWTEFANSPFGSTWGDWRVTGVASTVSSNVTGVTSDGPSLFTSTDTTTTTTTTSSRSGSKVGVSSTTSSFNLGTYVEDIGVQPYIAPAEIAFFAWGLRPTTRLYSYFDNVQVDGFVAPGVRNTAVTDTTSSDYVTRTANYGTPIQTDSSGQVFGKFLIPAATFRTGERSFRLCDISNVKLGEGAVTTSTSATYTASNFTVTTQTSTLTTVNPVLGFTGLSDTSSSTTSSTTTNVTTSNNPNYVPPQPPPAPNVPSPEPEPTPVLNTEQPAPVATPAVVIAPAPPDPAPVWQIAPLLPVPGRPGLLAPWGIDPIAQNIRIQVDTSLTGMFLTQIGVYFQGKPLDTSVGFTMYMTAVSNGYPDGTQVFELSRTYVRWDQVQTSQDGSVETVITMPSPVYVNNSMAYSFVIVPDGGNPDYKLWTAVLGDFDVASGIQVSSVPYIENCFYSSNALTWTALQDERLKFNLYRASFNSYSGTGAFVNSSRETFKLTSIQNASVNATIGPSDYVFGANSSGVIPSVKAKVTTFYNANNQLEAIESTGNFSGLGQIQVHRLSSDTMAPNANTLISTGIVTKISDIPMNTFVPRLATIEPAGTSLQYTFKSTSESFVPDAVTQSCTLDVETEMFDFPRIVASRSNEVSLMGGANSLTLNAIFKSDSDYLSPVVDLIRSNCLAIANIIDPTSYDFTQEYGISGPAKNKYLSKVITLASGQDSEDLQLYLTAYKPFTSKIRMFARFLNGEDSDSITLKTWTQLAIDDDTVVSDYRKVTDYRDLLFTVPNSIPAGAPATTAWVDPVNGLTYTDSTGQVYTSYKTFQIKIVLLSDSTAVVPRANDVRGLAMLL